MLKLITLAVFAMIAVNLASANVRFRSCGASTVKKIIVEGSDNKATPTLFRGKSYTIKADYIAGSTQNSVKTQFFAILNGATVKWEGIHLADGCSSVVGGCPIVKGKSHTYTERITVPADAPPMRTVVKVQQTNPDTNAESLCVIFSLLIK